jgi:hypothetical protein
MILPTRSTPFGPDSGKARSTSIKKEAKVMAKVKKGDALNCEVCGLVVVVDEACGCAAAEILCCEQPMVKGKSAAKKKPAAKAVAAPAKIAKKAAAKATPKKINAKTSAKTAAKAKPAAKKPTRTKK